MSSRRYAHFPHALFVVFAVFGLSNPVLAQTPAAPSWSLAIHGGAGTIERDHMTPAQDAAYRAALQRALDAGSAVLSQGGSALDAVQAAVQVMEDDPLFNAGRGAVFTAAGRNELDAAVMNGADLTAGAVAGLTTTRHPVAAARAVMEQSPHVMLIGPGADAFAAQAGLEQVDPAFFFTERRWQGLTKALTEAGLPLPARPAGAPAPGAQAAVAPPLNEKKFGTVGAVALDSRGRLAAATSTGGMTAKRWGRVGDVPVIGAGTYASNADGCAVSATGSGEYFIRSTVARDICRRTADGATVQAAAEAEMADVGSIGGDGGVIVMGLTGTPAFAMNTSGMYRGAVSSTAAARVAIYADEP
ncbi:MAG: isoaspartyl peptidase/L-asparaginase [Alphaproteobacteria bacterium]|nr:isoaspartyl peptidase/L-asparaginase [Alphaproteobacteria bacterium]MBU1521332.1 isoaspartyl peptidase/L-asparaginase [Alphaproteobacteria bacterium]MBU2029392.1 isoaspartyl peptidase/L-asparaginase [Alphaproteobacteria bacterium]MBU2165112.1 isoaspartyl peptidase/L-asparaginase [Alphaproteobacteria bacterium]MBU2232591.1 isoaspartyl peptidase/L-asparaginase [Alphaproteobacteria bacterium]